MTPRWMVGFGALGLLLVGCQEPGKVVASGPVRGAIPAAGEIGAAPGGKPLRAPVGMLSKPRKLERAVSNPGMDPNGSMTMLQRTRPDPNPNRRAGPVFFGMLATPDQSGADKAKLDGATVELVGTCEVSLNDVACWKPDGTPNAALAKTVLGTLKKPENRMQGAAFANPDKDSKVRGVAVKVTLGGPAAPSLFAFAPDTLSLGGTMTLVAVRTPANASKGTVSLPFASPATASGQVDCKDDAKGTFDGVEMSVITIKEAAARMMSGPGETPAPVTAWRISLRLKDPARNYRNLVMQPLDKTGKPILFSDENGNPAAKGRPSVSDATAQRDGALNFTITVDPAKIGKLLVKANRVKRVDLLARMDPLK